jgi:Protein of unknown function (DUF1800)
MKYFKFCILAIVIYAKPMFAAEEFHPAWWTQVPIPAPSVQNAVRANTAPLVEGQLKQLCTKALAEIISYQKLRKITSGDPFLERLTTSVEQRNLNSSDPTPGNHLLVMTQGQLKNAAQPFLDYLADIGYAKSRIYPWSESGQNNLAIAQIGMAKYLFSFDLRKDTDGDTVPDWWEAMYFGPNAVIAALIQNTDSDSDGQPDLNEYSTNTDPTTGLITPKMENARFHNQATFGATDVESYIGLIDRTAWIDNQLVKPASIFAPPEYLFAYRNKEKAPPDYDTNTPGMQYHPDSLPMPADDAASPPSYTTQITKAPNEAWHQYKAGDGLVHRYAQCGSYPSISNLAIKLNPDYMNLEFVEVDFNSLLVHNSISGEDQLRQRMALALSQLFVVSYNDAKLGKYGSAYGVADYYNKLNSMAFGRIADITKMVARHPVMGIYLNSASSLGTAPNENFARELLQLFTIGTTRYNNDGSFLIKNGSPSPAYEEKDVKAFAKIFSGYELTNNLSYLFENSQEPWFRKGWVMPMVRTYSPYEGTVELSSLLANDLGISSVVCIKISTDHPGELVIEKLAKHPNAAILISLHLIRSFVKANPSSDYVKAVAKVFSENESNPNQLGLVIKKILTHEEATIWPVNRSLSGMVREPFVKFIHAARALGYGAVGRVSDIPANRVFADFPIPWKPTMGAISVGVGEYKYPDNSDTNRAITRYGVFGDTSYTGREAFDFFQVCGQWPMYSPSVFNFYRPDHVPVEWSTEKLSAYSPTMQIHTSDRILNTYDQLARGLFSNFLGGTRWNAGALLHPLNSPIERWRERLKSPPSAPPTPPPSFDAVVTRMSETLTGGRFKLGNGTMVRDLRLHFQDSSKLGSGFTTYYTANRRFVDATAAFLVLSSPEFSVLE